MTDDGTDPGASQGTAYGAPNAPSHLNPVSPGGHGLGTMSCHLRMP